MNADKALSALAWLGYPALIFFGLQWLEPRYVAVLLALLLLLRHRRGAGQLAATLSRADRGVLVFLLAWIGATVVTNNEWLLRCYPAAVNLGLLLLFGLSLRAPTSMIERFARLSEPDLPPAGVAYTRRVTQVWCGFFVLNGGLALYTALWTSRETWALYNGLVAYLMMGALFAIEWLFRRRLMARSATPPPVAHTP